MDLTDLYMTSLRLGGVLDKLPDSLYFDGIDQTAFLLAKDGKSRRQVVYMWSREDFCALRWRDYKVHFKVFQTVDARRNIDASLLQDIGTAPWIRALMELLGIASRKNGRTIGCGKHACARRCAA